MQLKPLAHQSASWVSLPGGGGPGSGALLGAWGPIRLSQRGPCMLCLHAALVPPNFEGGFILLDSFGLFHKNAPEFVII